MQDSQAFGDYSEEPDYQGMGNYSKGQDSQAPENVAPLPEDLRVEKKKRSVNEIINIISYITLGIAGLFLLILFLLGFLR